MTTVSFIIVGGGCPEFIHTENGWKHQSIYIEDRSFPRYLKTRYCHFSYAFYDASGHITFTEKMDQFLGFRFLKFYVWIISTLLLIYSTLRPVPAPLVADRKNRLLYTHRKGKLYVADWNSLAFSIVAGLYYRHTLTVQLFTQTPSGDWEPRWFTLAEHNYGIREWRNFYLGTLEVAFHRYWGQRCWLLRYMDLGPDAVHGVMPHKGVFDRWHFRHQTLPDDITQQARDAVAHNGGKAPVDSDFVNTKPEKEVKHLLKLDDRLDLTALPK